MRMRPKEQTVISFVKRALKAAVLPECSVGTTNQSARDAWLAETLSEIPGGGVLLDAGAGEGKYRPLCSHLTYVSQDFAQYDGHGDGAALQTGGWDQSRLDIVSDIISIPRPDASFDAVLCVEVLEHLPRPSEALAEMARLLKPGGVLILTAPFCALTHFAPHFYQTGYSRYFYRYWLEDLGFSIEKLDINGNYFEYLAQEVRRLPWAAQTYAPTVVVKRRHRFAMGLIVQLLQRLSQADVDSGELLSYGLHVKARKGGSARAGASRPAATPAS